MIENQQENAKGIENAQRAVEQAKARLANEKRKANAAKRKAENQHKYMMGGIVHKYFPECYAYDEAELNEILSAGIRSAECRNAVTSVTRRARGTNAGNQFLKEGGGNVGEPEKQET